MLYSRFFSPILARWSFATSPIRRKPSVTTVLLPTTRSYASSIESLPRVAQPSLWHSIVPRFLRKSRKSEKGVQSTKPKEWNPATFFIIIFMLIGSNAIQMIALRNDFTTFSRRADAKIGLLKEVIDRVQRGEEVDVERILGTNDKEKESEWEEGMSCENSNPISKRARTPIGNIVNADVSSKFCEKSKRKIVFGSRKPGRRETRFCQVRHIRSNHSITLEIIWRLPVQHQL